VAVVILIALFAFQPQGTARIGRTFGPVMAVWFVTIAVLGVAGLARHPAVLFAINPVYGLRYLVDDGSGAFLVLGGVFLRRPPRRRLSDGRVDFALEWRVWLFRHRASSNFTRL
jgi:K+ transporter